MGIARRQQNIRINTSTLITIPAQLQKGETSTVAANRLVLADPRGEIPEKDLLEFLESYVEPGFWAWVWEKRSGRSLQRPVDLEYL